MSYSPKSDSEAVSRFLGPRPISHKKNPGRVGKRGGRRGRGGPAGVIWRSGFCCLAAEARAVPFFCAPALRPRDAVAHGVFCDDRQQYNFDKNYSKRSAQKKRHASVDSGRQSWRVSSRAARGLGSAWGLAPRPRPCAAARTRLAGYRESIRQAGQARSRGPGQVPLGSPAAQPVDSAGGAGDWGPTRSAGHGAAHRSRQPSRARRGCRTADDTTSIVQMRWQRLAMRRAARR